MLKIHSMKKELTRNEIINLVNQHNMMMPRFIKLKNMYENKNAIKSRVQEDKSKPNNKISHAYADYIVNSIVGYFMGKAITYSFNDEALQSKFDDLFKYNDESAENTQLATDASIYGVGCELLYLDAQLNPRFRAISPLESIAIYDCSIEENIIGFIRHWKIKNVDEKDIDYIEYYTNEKIIKFTTSDNSQAEVSEHSFNDVPVVVVDNNKDLCGDFEKVIDLMDALDKVVSDTANDFETFTNAILMIAGTTLDDEVLSRLKDSRILNIADGTGAKAEYLFKDLPDQALENYKNRLVDDIHKFSSVPNMSDENFANNLSGVSMQFKLSSLEFKCAIKESYFRKALLRRIELICNVLSLLGVASRVDEIIRNVDIRFTRNTINNNEELVARSLQLSTLLSKETLLENLLPFIPSVEVELERLANEREESISFMQDNFDSHEPVEDSDDLEQEGE